MSNQNQTIDIFKIFNMVIILEFLLAGFDCKSYLRIDNFIVDGLTISMFFSTERQETQEC